MSYRIKAFDEEKIFYPNYYNYLDRIACEDSTDFDQEPGSVHMAECLALLTVFWGPNSPGGGLHL